MAENTNQEILRNLEETASLAAIHHLPYWSRFQAERIVPAVTALLDEVEAQFDALEQNIDASWEGLMAPLERMQLRLGVLLGTVGHLLSVKYSDELQAAYDEVRPRYVAFSNRMAHSKAVHDGMVSIRDGAEFAELGAARQRILTESIRGMERSGVHLEGEAKARYEEIQHRLSELSNNFSTNLVREEKGSRIKVTDAGLVDGVPASILAAAADQAKEDRC